jgi:dihydrofolate reductase
MRIVRLSVAMSIDGYIAGPNGESDWITIDPDIDFDALTTSFDTVLLGRKTFEATVQHGGGGMRTVVFSRTLRQEDHKGVTISADPAETVADLKSSPGKEIWLFGGGELFRSMLELGLVDAVQIAVIPVFLGGGVPLLPQPASRAKLRLTGHEAYPKTGTVLLEYEPEYEPL